MPSKRKFAAFDIDGTISRNAIFFAVVDELISREHIPKEAGLQLAEKLEQYRQRTHANVFNEYSRLSIDILLTHLTSLKVSDYQKAVDEVLKRSKQYSYVYTRELIKDLKAKGYFLIALSGSEMHGVKQFGQHYGFDIAIGEVYDEKNGFFTGTIKQVVHKKDMYLKALIKEHDLDPNGSIAVGDSKGDLGMLETVQRPIAFNPESSLYDVAIERGWEIVVERKNVIYNLTPTKNGYQLKV